jgi:prevent-host-death family protein
METIAVSKFRTNLMQILKRIEHGSIITITSHGKPVAKLTPPEDIIKTSQYKLEQIRKTAIVKDVLSPIDEKWEALK